MLGTIAPVPKKVLIENLPTQVATEWLYSAPARVKENAQIHDPSTPTKDEFQDDYKRALRPRRVALQVGFCLTSLLIDLETTQSTSRNVAVASCPFTLALSGVLPLTRTYNLASAHRLLLPLESATAPGAFGYSEQVVIGTTLF